MNCWQEKFCSIYYGGKKPRTKVGKEKYNLLGDVESVVRVTLPKGEVVEYRVGDVLDIPNGLINVEALSSNLLFWASKGYTVTTY